MPRVTLYIRQSSSRKFKRVTDKQTFAGGNFPAGTVFVLRYKRGGKRVFETLKDCPDLSTAQQLQLERRLHLMRGTLPPAPVPKLATVKPLVTAHQPGVLMLDAQSTNTWQMPSSRARKLQPATAAHWISSMCPAATSLLPRLPGRTSSISRAICGAKICQIARSTIAWLRSRRCCSAPRQFLFIHCRTPGRHSVDDHGRSS